MALAVGLYKVPWWRFAKVAKEATELQLLCTDMRVTIGPGVWSREVVVIAPLYVLHLFSARIKSEPEDAYFTLPTEVTSA